LSSSSRKGASGAFSDFLNRFQKRVATKPFGGNEFRIKLERDLPGLFNLLNSFSSVAMNSNRPESFQEWNPFSQRTYLTETQFSKDPSAFIQFDTAIRAIDHFIEVSHEANHVLLWEPLFVGKCKNISRRRFVDASLFFEAYCFWYADIIVTRNLRTKLPDGEFVRIRSAPSQPNFHPYRAFKAMGIEQPEKILDIYFKCFMGGETELYHSRDKPYVADLLRRFIAFYDESLKPSRLLFKQLTAMNFFNDFYRRFCSIPGLPSLLPERILNMDSLKEPWAYCHAIRGVGYRHIDNISESHISKVRVRRFIQTRAYTAYSLIYALESGSVFSRNRKKINSEEILGEIKHYINTLETMIQALGKGSPLEHIQRICRRADQMYSQKIRPFFISNDIWMSRRLFIFPPLKTKTSYFGILNDKEKISKPDLLKLNQTLLIQFCNPKLSMMASFKTKSDTRMARDTGDLLAASSRVGERWTPLRAKEWKSAYNEVLLDSEILQQWSVPLAAIDPEHNTFREILFIYQ